MQLSQLRTQVHILQVQDLQKLKGGQQDQSDFFLIEDIDTL